MPSKQRHAVNDTEQKALRAQYVASSASKPDLNALARQFKASYKRDLDKSTVSRILSDKCSYLDEASVPWARESKRRQEAAHPGLELALQSQQLRIEAMKIVVTGKALQTTVVRFWSELPQYSSSPLPLFSNSQLEGFKKRHGIQLWRFYREAGLVDLEEAQVRV